MSGGEVQGRLAVLILCVYIRPFGNKQLGDIAVAMNQCEVQRPPAMLIFCVNVRAFGEKEFDDVFMALLCGEV